ncbi:hypothetical protein ACFC0D_14390 [Streptomyces sp. NPDC056222]|uniref:hypothetical protein n=1 Tax=Streptomyces sp. NPDC056222 TaxID=3345749 RepID=UPI0035D9FC00
MAFGGAALAGAPAAVAAPGDEGDIKVHHAGRPGEVSRTGENSPVNNPSVCTFYFAAFDFDGLQSINWAITPQPSVDSVTTSGSIPIDAAGSGISPDLTLADGRYKVEWTWEGQQGPEKSKIFRVDCDDSAGPPPTNGNGGNRGAAANSGNGATGNGSTGNGSTASGSGANGGTANGSGSWNGGTGSATSSATGGTGSWNGGTGSATSSATGGTGSWNGGTGNGGTGNGASPSSTSSANGWSGGSGGGATKPPQGPVGAGGGGSADTTGTDGSAFGVGSAIAAALAGTVGLILVRRSRRRTDGAA